jgi:integrase
VSALRRLLRDYLALRRSLGFKLVTDGQLLPGFLTDLEDAQESLITVAGALRWATRSSHVSSHPRRLSVVRTFARHAHAIDPRHEIPPTDLLPRKSVRRPPFLFAEADVLALMKAAERLEGFMAETHSTLIGLLASTGMRVGEAIRLDTSDLDTTAEILTIRDGKFGKSREIPLCSSTVSALEKYLRARVRFCRRPKTQSFFLSQAGTRPFYSCVQLKISRLIDDAGLGERKPRPRIHDLRHSFAVWTLADWYRTRVDIEARLPVLSTYLGHVSPVSTYWYLSLSPDLIKLAGRRLERTLGDLP